MATGLAATPQRIKNATAAIAVVQLVLTALALVGGETIRAVVAACFVAIFIAGGALFLWGFVLAAGRSRDEDVPVGGVFFLTGGSVDSADRRWFYVAVAIQSIVGLGGAIAQPFTGLAFGTLVPLFGVGAIALFGAKYGTFTADRSGA